MSCSVGAQDEIEVCESDPWWWGVISDHLEAVSPWNACRQFSQTIMHIYDEGIRNEIGIPYEEFVSESIPETPAVYQILGPGLKVLYVGKAVNLRARFGKSGKSHHKNDLAMCGKCRIRFWFCERSDIALIETVLIRQLLPLWNDRIA